jgi:hypothetical protein
MITQELANMRKSKNITILFIILLGSSLEVYAQEAPNVSIKEVMESLITPVTNVLWGANDPQTDEEWQVLEDAAISVIASGAVINLGGTGPQDNAWAQDPVWRAFTKVMTDAGEDALKAIRDRNIDALFEAGNVLYPPCEGCHLQFNPGVINQNQ